MIPTVSISVIIIISIIIAIIICVIKRLKANRTKKIKPTVTYQPPIKIEECERITRAPCAKSRQTKLNIPNTPALTRNTSNLSEREIIETIENASTSTHK